ncbi:hypothetical protein CsSME_00025901 [Camellia sinensis var. sinensis]
MTTSRDDIKHGTAQAKQSENEAFASEVQIRHPT